VRPSIEEPLLYERVNCAGTLNVLECARQSGVRMFVFGSSSSVYGVSERVPFREDDPVDRPVSPYAASKRQRPDLAISKFTRLIEEGQPIQMFGDGSSRRDYTFISDIVDGIMAALDSELRFEIINLGNSRPVELRELIALIEEALGKKARIEQLPDQPGDVPVTYADIGKANRLLGYRPAVPIRRGIRAFVEWFRTPEADRH